MKLRILLIAGSLPFALIAMAANASGGNCPAFTSSMVDAAMLATEYSQPEPVVGEAYDSPSEPSIFCAFGNNDEGFFLVAVGYDEDQEPPSNFAHLVGNSPVKSKPGFATQLRTLVLNLTEAEKRACRAQVLASFTWKQYCEPLMQ